MDKPSQKHLAAQCQALLRAWENAGPAGLKTGELLRFTYIRKDAFGEHVENIGDWRARKSDLKKAGYIFKKVKQVGGGFIHILTGFKEPVAAPLLPGLELAEVG